MTEQTPAVRRAVAVLAAAVANATDPLRSLADAVVRDDVPEMRRQAEEMRRAVDVIERAIDRRELADRIEP